MSATPATTPESDPLMPAREIAGFYHVHIGSVGRWVKTRVFPGPDVVLNGRNYWRRSTVERVNRERTIEHAAARLEDRKRVTPANDAVHQLISEVLGSEELRQHLEAMLRAKLAAKSCEAVSVNTVSET